MILRITTGLVALIILLAIAAAAFRIYTAPERIQKRLEVAKETCLKSGGSWVLQGREPICKRD